MKPIKKNKWTAQAVFLAVLTLSPFALPAYSQQDVNPTWYDPWEVTTNAAPHSHGSKAADKAKAPDRNTPQHPQKVRKQLHQQKPAEVKREIAKK